MFKGVDALVKNFLVSVPLVADLRSPAMRDRHWQQLMDTTKVPIDVNNPTFCLSDLLALELHKYEEEVGEIVDRCAHLPPGAGCWCMEPPLPCLPGTVVLGHHSALTLLTCTCH